MYIVLLITCANRREAHRIADALVAKKHAACVNVVEGVTSLFWWKGKTERAKETLLIVKSKRSRLAALIALVKSLHSYSVPEIIALPIIGGNKDYLRWIDESVAAHRRPV